jgi:hypothetical protein
MIQDEKDRTRNRCYLLGILDEPQQQELEQRLLTDETFSEELKIVEDELIDDYLAGRLTPAEREQFELHFLAAPVRQKDLQFSRVFKQYVADATIKTDEERKTDNETVPPFVAAPDIPPVPAARNRPAFFNTIVIICLLTLVSGGMVYWLLSSRAPGREGIEQELAQLNEPGRQGQSPTGASPETYKTTLTPGLTRDSGAMKTLQIPAQSALIEVELELPISNYSTYQATIINKSAELYTVKHLRASPENGSHLVRLYLLPKYLPRGDYLIKLSGIASDGKIEGVGSYPFRVASQ